MSDRAKNVLIFCILTFSTGNLSSWAAETVPKALVDLTIRPSMVQEFSEDEKELLNEYRRQYLRIVDLYRNVKMVAKWKQHIATLDEKDGATSTSVRNAILTYRSNAGQFLRMDEERVTIEDGPIDRVLVVLTRPEGYLTAVRDNEASAFMVRELIPSFDEGEDVISGWVFQWAPHSVYAQPVHRFLFSNWVDERFVGFHFTRVMLDRQNETELVTFHVSCKTKRDGRDWAGVFTFDRSNGWVMTEYRWGVAELNSDADSSSHGLFEYVGSSDGIGLLRRADYWYEIGPKQRKSHQQQFDIVEIVPGPVPLEEFSPEALGIRHLGRHRSNWTWTVLGLLVGVALIIVYLVLRRRESLARKGD